MIKQRCHQFLFQPRQYSRILGAQRRLKNQAARYNKTLSQMLLLPRTVKLPVASDDPRMFLAAHV